MSGRAGGRVVQSTPERTCSPGLPRLEPLQSVGLVAASRAYGYASAAFFTFATESLAVRVFLYGVCTGRGVMLRGRVN